MPDTPTQDDGQALVARVSTEMVRAQKEFFGKGPTQAKSYFVDDMLIIVMKGGLTTAELTMLSFGHHDLVRTFRQTFENEMTERLTDMIEGVTGRKVLTYQSQVLFDPHRVIEMFVFDEDGPDALIDATATGQLERDHTGEAPVDDPGLDDPSTSGPAGS